MTQQDDTQGQAGAVQFENAEYATPSAAVTCVACKQAIADTYFTAGQAIVCPRCRDALSAAQSGGSKAGRFFGALGWGLLAAVVGSLIWFGVRKATGYEIGLVAIVVGVIVGVGVRRGSGRRGGWLYQTMAVLLTYTAIVSQYVPDVYQGLRKEMDEERTQTKQADSAAAASATQPTAEGSDVAAPRAEHKKIGMGKAILYLLLLGAILFVIAFVAPIFAGFSNIIGLLIIGFALYEAWKLNKRIRIAFAGPFAVTSLPVTPPGAGA